MYPLRKIPHTILIDIDRALERNRNDCIAVYSEAERVRRKWVQENVALEDIVMAFFDRCAPYEVAMSLDMSGAEAALMGDGPGYGSVASRSV